MPDQPYRDLYDEVATLRQEMEAARAVVVAAKAWRASCTDAEDVALIATVDALDPGGDAS
jgi:hypothetical protein